MKISTILFAIVILVVAAIQTAHGQETLRKSIYFETARHDIDPSSKQILDELIQSLSDKKDYTITITGNTDNVGDSLFNMKLSEARVNATKEYLLTGKIPATAFETAHFGESKPIKTNDTEEGKQQNRRVDIVVNFKVTEPEIETVEEVPSILELYKQLERGLQEFKIDPTKDNSLVCEQGTIISIKANSLKLSSSCKDKEATIRVREDFLKSDMILDNLSTTSNSRALETQGMVYIEAEDCKGNQVTMSKKEEITVMIPTDSVRPDIKLFIGDRSGHNDMMNWALDNTPELDDMRIEELNICWDFICGTASSCNRCKFWCRVGRFGLAMKGISDYETRMDNRNFRACQRELKSRERWVRRTGIAFNSPQNPNRWPGMDENLRPKCERLDELFKEYDVDNLQDLMLAVNKPMLDSFKVSTMEELRDTLEKVKLHSIEDAYASNNVSFDDFQYYVFNTNRLGWINLDEFAKMPKRQLAKMSIDLKPADNIDCKLVFKKREAVLPLYPDNNKYSINDIPKGEEVWLVALKYHKNKPYFAMKEVSVGNDTHKMDFEELSLEELKERLKVLNL